MDELGGNLWLYKSIGLLISPLQDNSVAYEQFGAVKLLAISLNVILLYLVLTIFR